jgi:hypothetical protein
LKVSNEDKKQKLSDVPPLATVCIVTTTFVLVVALLVGAPIPVTASLGALLAALALYIKRTLS